MNDESNGGNITSKLNQKKGSKRISDGPLLTVDEKDISKIVKIQRTLKLNRIRKHLNKIDLRDLDKSFSELDYDKTMIWLMEMTRKKDPWMHNVNVLMFRINRYMNPEKKTVSRMMGRMFFSLYLLKYHYKEILVTVNANERALLHYQATNIINYLNDLFMKNRDYTMYSANRFGTMFNAFCAQYNMLQGQDKVNLINEPYRHYANVKTTKKYVEECSKYPDDQKADIIKVLDEELQKAYRCALMLDKNFDIKKFDEIESLEDKIRSGFNDKYWEKVSEDLKNENYEELMKLLSKLKNIVLDLHPEEEVIRNTAKTVPTSREKMKREFEEWVDNDFIKQRLENRVMDDESIINLCTYLMNVVKGLQASVRDEELADMWSYMIEKFKTGGLPMNEFIPMFFKKIFLTIDKICSDVLLIPIMCRTAKFKVGDQNDKCK